MAYTRSIKQKITLRVGLAVGLVLLVLIGFVSGAVRMNQVTATTQRGQAVVNDLAHQIEVFNHEGLVLARTMAVYQESGGFGHREATLRYLHDLIMSRPEYFGTWTLYARNADGQDAAWIGRPGAHAKTGQFLPFWNPTSTGKTMGAAEDITETFDPYHIWTMARNPSHEFIMEPYLYNEELQTSYGRAFFIDGKLKGVVGIDRSLNKIDEMLRREKPYRTATFVLLSPTGHFLAAPDVALATQPIAKVPEQQAAFAPIVGATAPGAIQSTNPFDHQRCWLFYSPVREGGWTLAMMVDEAEIMAPVNQAIATILGMGLVGLLLVSLLLYGTIAKAIAPLEPLAQACEATAQGDLDTVQALVRTTAPGSEDEFARMAAAFRDAVRYLTDMAERLEQVARGDMSVRITPISDHDRFGKALAQYVVTIADTIDQLNRTKEVLHQRNEQLKDLDRLKTEFVNAVTHDLRTPLTSIKGYVEFMEDGIGGPVTEDQREYLAQIEKGANRLEKLVEDLLDVARLEAGTFRLRCDQADLRGTIDAVIQSLMPQAQAAQLTLEASVPEAPLVTRFDAERIERVLTNLANNAIKFTPEGGGIRVRAWRDADAVRCEVEDTGIGIAPEDMPKLFQRFGQLASGVARGGTGLGLSISKSIVEAHGGAIGVRSAPGRGTTIWFTLPAS